MFTKRLHQLKTTGGGLVFLLSLLWLLFAAAIPAYAQEEQAIDIMLVIDNSRSMACNLRPTNNPSDDTTGALVCDPALGSDPELLRLDGAKHFLLRLGFGADNVGDYRIGVISLGNKPPNLIASLTSLADTKSRDELFEKIQNNVEETLQTQIVPALEEAYEQLDDSQVGNTQAIILLTDGEPYPEAGQSCAEITTHLAQRQDVLTFVLLLQNPDVQTPGSELAERFQAYTDCWSDIQDQLENVVLFSVPGRNSLDGIYQDIIESIEGTTALATGKELTIENSPQLIPVNELVNQIRITIFYEPGTAPGSVFILDTEDTPVEDGQAGVHYFRGSAIPGEIYVIDRQRIEQAVYGDWQIHSTSGTTVFYSVDVTTLHAFRFPEGQATSVPRLPNEWSLVQEGRWPASEPFRFSFELVRAEEGQDLDQASVLTYKVPITATLIYPDGKEVMVDSNSITYADNQYTISLLFADFDGVRQQPGRYRIRLRAEVGQLPAEGILRVLVGLVPFLEFDAGDSSCLQGADFRLSVLVREYDAAHPETITVKAQVGTNEEVSLELVELLNNDQTARFESNQVPCQEGVQVTLSGVTRDNEGFDAVPLSIPINIIFPPTLTPTPTGTRIPTATPIPTVTSTPTLSPTPTTAPTPTATPTPVPTIVVGPVSIPTPYLPYVLLGLLLLILAVVFRRDWTFWLFGVLPRRLPHGHYRILTSRSRGSIESLTDLSKDQKSIKPTIKNDEGDILAVFYRQGPDTVFMRSGSRPRRVRDDAVEEKLEERTTIVFGLDETKL